MFRAHGWCCLVILLCLTFSADAGRRHRSKGSKSSKGHRRYRKFLYYKPRRRQPRQSRKKFPLTLIRSIEGNENGGRGAAHVQLLRMSRADYPDDGSGNTMKQPPAVVNARDISNHCAQQTGSTPNSHQMTDMMWAWGQFLDHDVSFTPTNPSSGSFNISVNNFMDPFSPGPIPFTRSEFDDMTGTSAGNPRQQVNEITAYIDASNVYGSDPVRAKALRLLEGGKLKTSRISDTDLLPFNLDGLDNEGGAQRTDLFVAGDVRANEQVGLLAMHTLFVREHNRLAGIIAERYPKANDNRVYHLARKIVGAEMQAITYNEFLPKLLGPMAPSEYQGFDKSVDPGIATEFSSAAYRVGHTMLSPSLMLADSVGQKGSIALQDAFFNVTFISNNPKNVDYLIGGFCHQVAQEIDMSIVDDVRNFLFGKPRAGGLDLASLNIQRGRDHGLPSYNEVRKAYGLQRAQSFSDVTDSTSAQEKLAEIYDSVNDIDLWVGALAETHVEGSAVGELVATVLQDQFSRLRDGDRFFYLNDKDFDRPAISAIINISDWKLSDVIRLNTFLDDSMEGVNVFDVPN